MTARHDLADHLAAALGLGLLPAHFGVEAEDARYLGAALQTLRRGYARSTSS